MIVGPRKHRAILAEIAGDIRCPLWTACKDNLYIQVELTEPTVVLPAGPKVPYVVRGTILERFF